eukprot:2058793-Alexandrium_andersonii.AAC.1
MSSPSLSPSALFEAGGSGCGSDSDRSVTDLDNILNGLKSRTIGVSTSESPTELAPSSPRDSDNEEAVTGGSGPPRPSSSRAS